MHVEGLRFGAGMRSRSAGRVHVIDAVSSYGMSLSPDEQILYRPTAVPMSGSCLTTGEELERAFSE